MIYIGLSCKRSNASRPFYFRAEQSNHVFKVEYLLHVEYAPKSLAVSWSPIHFNIINCLIVSTLFQRIDVLVDLHQPPTGHNGHAAFSRPRGRHAPFAELCCYQGRELLSLPQ